MDKLLLLGPQEIQSSIAAGLTPAAVPVWADADNLVFAELGIKSLRGADTLFRPTSTVRAIKQGREYLQLRAYIGTETDVWMHTNQLGISADTQLLVWPTAGDYVNLETWGTWLIMNNGIDPVYVWKNTGVPAPLAGTTFSQAKIILRRSPHLLAFNTDNGEAMYEWSHFSDIETWVPAPANDAGNLVIRDLESGINAAVPLGARIAAYGSASMSIISYLGRPNIFGHAPGPRGIGAVSAKSIVAQGPYNYGMMQNGVFKTDGNSFGWIDDPLMTKWLRTTCNWDMAKYIWAFHDDYLRVIHWFFLDDNLTWHNLVFHYDANMLTKGNIQATAAAERESWEVPIVAGADRRVGLWQQGDLINEVRPAFFIRSKPLDFGDRSTSKIIQLVRADGQWNENTRMRVGCLSGPNGSPEWYYDEAFVEKNYFADERDATYHVVEIYGDREFLVTGLEFFGKAGGVQI